MAHAYRDNLTGELYTDPSRCINGCTTVDAEEAAVATEARADKAEDVVADVAAEKAAAKPADKAMLKPADKSVHRLKRVATKKR